MLSLMVALMILYSSNQHVAFQKLTTSITKGSAVHTICSPRF